MQNGSLAAVGGLQLHVVVGTGADVLYVLHVVIHALEHMMAGRAQSNQRLTLFLGLCQSTDRGQLGSDLVSAQGVNTAAALPVGKLFQLET